MALPCLFDLLDPLPISFSASRKWDGGRTFPVFYQAKLLGQAKLTGSAELSADSATLGN
jgi:hypothetical protein